MYAPLPPSASPPLPAPLQNHPSPEPRESHTSDGSWSGRGPLEAALQVCREGSGLGGGHRRAASAAPRTVLPNGVPAAQGRRGNTTTTHNLSITHPHPPERGPPRQRRLANATQAALPRARRATAPNGATRPSPSPPPRPTPTLPSLSPSSPSTSSNAVQQASKQASKQTHHRDCAAPCRGKKASNAAAIDGSGVGNFPQIPTRYNFPIIPAFCQTHRSGDAVEIDQPWSVWDLGFGGVIRAWEIGGKSDSERHGPPPPGCQRAECGRRASWRIRTSMLFVVSCIQYMVKTEALRTSYAP